MENQVENQMKNNVESDVKQKKDAMPIFVFIGSLIITLGLATIMLFVLLFCKWGTNLDLDMLRDSTRLQSEVESMEEFTVASAVIEFGVKAITFIFFAIFYRKMLIKDFKRIGKKEIITILIMFVICLLGNIAITALFEYFNVTMSNQEGLNDMFGSMAILTSIMVVIIAPLIEEIVFRHSIGSLIKNNIVFIIVSSLLFGMVHGIGVVTLLYFYIGLVNTLAYLKTDRNIMCAFFVHMLNNLAAVILMALGL